MNESCSFLRRPVPPDGRRSDHLGLVPVHSRCRTSLLQTHPLPALAQTLFPVQAPPKLPLSAQKLPPSHAPLSPAQTYLPTHPPPSAHAVPIQAPPRRSPGSPVKACSGRFSWVAARSARVAPPPTFIRRASGNCLSGVGCGVSYDDLTYDDLASGEVADAEGSPRLVSVDAKHDALGPTWRQFVLGIGSPQISDSSKRDEVIKRGPVSDPEFV